MKPNLVYIFFLLSISFSISAQNNISTFEQKKKLLFEPLSFEEAIQKADKENKFVFVDVYTDWCKPCKEMDKYVFTDSTVFSLYNNDFVNIKIDGDSKIGKKFVHQYAIQGYPSSLFFDSKGNLLKKSEGYLNTLLLYDIGLQLTTAGSVKSKEEEIKKIIAELYKQNPCDIYNTQEYLASLNEQEYEEYYSEIVMLFMSCIEEKNLYTSEYLLYLLDHFITTKSDIAYPFYEKHKEDFRKNYGDSLIVLESNIMFSSFFEQMETIQKDIDSKGQMEQQHIDDFENSVDEIAIFGKTVNEKGIEYKFEAPPIARFYNVIQNISSIFYSTNKNKEMYYKYLIEYNQPIHFEKSIVYFNAINVFNKTKKQTLHYLDNFYSATDELKELVIIWQYVLDNNYLHTSSDYLVAAKLFWLHKDKEKAIKMLGKTLEVRDETFDEEKYNELKTQINKL